VRRFDLDFRAGRFAIRERPQRVVHGGGIWEALSYIGIERDDRNAGLELSGIRVGTCF